MSILELDFETMSACTKIFTLNGRALDPLFEIKLPPDKPRYSVGDMPTKTTCMEGNP